MKLRLLCRKLLLIVLALSVTACSWFRMPPQGPPSSPRGQPTATVGVGITVAEARRLALSLGLTGRRALPPGIERNLLLGKPLPPGIARQLVPSRMLARLPHIDGHEWLVLGTNLVLIAIGTAVVVEILEDVFD